ANARALLRASEAGIPAFHFSSRTHPDSAELDAAICQTLRSHGVDVVFLAGYMRQLGPITLSRFPGRILNTHPALLPKFGGQGMYGHRVHEAVLASGDRESGVAVRVRECDAKLEAHLATFADKSCGQKLLPKPRRCGRRHNEPVFAVRLALHRMSGHDLTVLEGIDDNTALVILSEIGTDMSKWPTEKHFTSWLGLCPQHQGSAGKIKSRRVRRGRDLAARAFRLAAQGCHHAKNALGAFYRRVQSRCGGIKAVFATARKIAERVYRLLKYGAEYVRQGIDAYEAAYRERLVKGLTQKARSLG